MKLLSLWLGTGRADEPAPRTLAEYCARVAAEHADSLALYRSMRTRLAELTRRGASFSTRLSARSHTLNAAVIRFRQTFTESDYALMLEAAQHTAALNAIHEADPSLTAGLMIEHLGPWSIVTGEFRDWKPRFAAMVAAMLASLARELERVEPIELESLRLESEQRAAAYGVQPSPPPGADHSPLLCQLRRLEKNLTTAHTFLRGGVANPQTTMRLEGFDLFHAVGQHINPILEQLDVRGQET